MRLANLVINPPPRELSRGTCLHLSGFTEVDSRSDRAEALEVCRNCPVLELCRAWTATMPRPRGVVQAGVYWPLIGRASTTLEDLAA